MEGDTALTCIVLTQYYEARESPSLNSLHSVFKFIFSLTVEASFADSSMRFKLSKEEFEVIEDIYKRPLKLRHFNHLIDRSRYFLDFELMASKGKKLLYLVYFLLFVLMLMR